ncbi:MAG: HAMP domain-containing histidine kinase [Chromatiaceae bacterium]|nr:HAMP domain-containing histidine kinase [Chromatiaceae bacterium]MCP5444515.1 HAMP domain-containing histidine kinase [Chromatiaceae bacterium]
MNNLFGLNSLRGKITSAYITLAISTLTLGIIAFLGLLFLEQQVTEGEVVADLRNAVLEMRREEKNLLLYADSEALARADEQATLSLELLQVYGPLLQTILDEVNPSDLTQTITEYQKKIRHWNLGSLHDQESIQESIRTLGQRIFISVESLSSRERRMLEQTVRKSQWFLFISLFMIGLSIFIVGRQLKRVAVTPLKQLESHLMPIAKGEFNHLNPPSDDREFVAFTDAFNRMLNELKIRQKRLLQSEKLASLGILASGVAHELNNPLSNISSSCQLLMEELTEADPAQLYTWLRQIDSETERGRNIVRTLLDFGSQHTFQRSPLGLRELIKETQLIVGKTLQQYSSDLIIDIPEKVVLKADKQRMQQLFINLIQNALHAGGQNVQVRIAARLCDPGPPLFPDGAEVAGDLKFISEYEGQYLEILVVDNGPGIPDSQLSKVFDPFFTTGEPGHGVGLGLYIVQEIVSEHDGCLAIVSHPGSGTEVIILLPYKDSASG